MEEEVRVLLVGVGTWLGGIITMVVRNNLARRRRKNGPPERRSHSSLTTEQVQELQAKVRDLEARLAHSEQACAAKVEQAEAEVKEEYRLLLAAILEELYQRKQMGSSKPPNGNPGGAGSTTG